ncbi:MAG TPA: superoxide dismutase [Ni] [Prolixibacteraceae bacterium]|nr:superoxide dismutase [Ni] [Prolixibacteraceae bacterium]
MKKLTGLFTIVVFSLAFNLNPFQAQAHCEIPCGIYGDSVRIALIYEHIETIQKSMDQINELSDNENPDFNQLIRWVVNKEEHAKKIQDIVSQYFLHQRIKPTETGNAAAYKKYQQQLEALHHILVFAMKAKQTTDISVVETLKEKVHNFEHLYFHSH